MHSSVRLTERVRSSTRPLPCQCTPTRSKRSWPTEARLRAAPTGISCDRIDAIPAEAASGRASATRAMAARRMSVIRLEIRVAYADFGGKGVHPALILSLQT